MLAYSLSDDSVSLAERVKEALGDRTQGWLEREAKLPKGYASYILSGKRKKLGPELMEQIASALEVSLRWLSTGLGPKAVPKSALKLVKDDDRIAVIDAVGRAIGADLRDIESAQTVRRNSGTVALTEEDARDLIEQMRVARRGLERSAAAASDDDERAVYNRTKTKGK